MREPAFWWRSGTPAATLLAPLGAAYGAVAAWRMDRAGCAAGLPVLCIGNLTVGGAGKTPAAIAAGQILKAAGKATFFLSRGYGGHLAGPVRVDPARHGPADVGDEPLLLARTAPTVVARDRIAAAAFAKAAGAGVAVMDDGFQNPSLAKDFSLIVVDGRRGIGNGRVFPAGPLRAPLLAQMERAQAVLVIGPPAGATAVTGIAAARGIPVFHGKLKPDAAALDILRAGPVLAFAGIGDPAKFFATLEQANITVAARRPFPDHHRYQRAEASSLLAQAQREGLALVTTEKDWVRLAGDSDLVALARVARTLPVALAVDEAAAFQSLILEAVR